MPAAAVAAGCGVVAFMRGQLSVGTGVGTTAVDDPGYYCVPEARETEFARILELHRYGNRHYRLRHDTLGMFETGTVATCAHQTQLARVAPEAVPADEVCMSA